MAIMRTARALTAVSDGDVEKNLFRPTWQERINPPENTGDRRQIGAALAMDATILRLGRAPLEAAIQTPLSQVFILHCQSGGSTSF
jgi:hypothetical protein